MLSYFFLVFMLAMPVYSIPMDHESIHIEPMIEHEEGRAQGYEVANPLNVPTELFDQILNCFAHATVSIRDRIGALCALRQTCKYFLKAITAAKAKAIFELCDESSALVQIIAMGDQNSLRQLRALNCFNIDTDKKILDHYFRSVLRDMRTQKRLVNQSDHHVESQFKAIDESLDGIVTMVKAFDLNASTNESGESLEATIQRVRQVGPIWSRACYCALRVAVVAVVTAIGVGGVVAGILLNPDSH